MEEHPPREVVQCEGEEADGYTNEELIPASIRIIFNESDLKILVDCRRGDSENAVNEGHLLGESEPAHILLLEESHEFLYYAVDVERRIAW